MHDMTGKTVVITGASRGIGEAAAHIFAQAGANVVLTARSASQIQAIAAEIGERALAVTCDVSNWSQVKAAIDLAHGRFGTVDVLINNAGVIEPIGPLETSDPEGWGHVIDVNLKGVYYGARAALPYMIEQGGGSILTISSGAAHRPLEGWAHYCTSKAGVHMFNEALHLETSGKGVRAIGLSPGTVATQMQREIKASGVNAVAQLNWDDHIPAEWPARALLWMCSEDADEYLGQEISLRDVDIRKRANVFG
ncbi:NADP-dependent 3-hydroxy acid dehydrogenase YdfG [Aliiroseovarius halocynthiae]|uniref:SDR family oxidoreductase n=1 Tax=Aliiroseovarius halocynthiae TaxID=985055 RepID=A0A545SLJ2_9RHOB|nr:SDR family oxidoreductase [Aliiroseovarius halocynthiae]TQV65853.1 SDR family oxidoreductase [Aliiroseovarius halocynthiae]SMR83520.1 NADP-dependent 3-hydroxy acid dehydrogenase YdfG [Aliiroseovarius halocynthiae]